MIPGTVGCLHLYIFVIRWVRHITYLLDMPSRPFNRDEKGFLESSKDRPTAFFAGGKPPNNSPGIFARLASQQGDPQYADSNLNAGTNAGGLDLSAKNEILDTDSLLQYPDDLGINPRLNHFMIFNIYKGTSDSFDVQERALQRAQSVLKNSPLAYEMPQKTFLDPSIKDLAAYGSASAYADSLLKAQKATELGVDPSAISAQQLKTYREEKPEAYKTLLDASTILYDNFGEDIAAYNASGGSTADVYTQPLYQKQTTNGGFLEPIANGTVASAKDIKDAAANIFGGQFAAAADNIAQIPGNALETKRDLGQNWETFSQQWSKTYFQNNTIPTNKKQVDSRGRRINQDDEILVSNRRFSTANVRSKDTIALYTPQNLVAGDAIGYDAQSMQAAALIFGTVKGEPGSISAMTNVMFRNLINQVGKVTGFVAGSDINGDAIVAAAQRSVPNPRRELMITEPGNRVFSYSFEMYPKNKKESETISDIVKMFRYHAYPKLQNNGGHFYIFPSEFEIEFYMLESIETENANGDKITGQRAVINGFIPRIGRCALREVQVNYTPNNIWQSIGDQGSPVGTVLNLVFEEMQPLNKEHIVHGY